MSKKITINGNVIERKNLLRDKAIAHYERLETACHDLEVTLTEANQLKRELKVLAKTIMSGKLRTKELTGLIGNIVEMRNKVNTMKLLNKVAKEVTNV